jgi:hypothetical protein
LQAGPDRLRLGATAAQDRVGAVGLVRQVEEVGPLSVVELQGPGDRVEHAGRCPGQAAAFELGVAVAAGLVRLGVIDSGLSGIAAAGNT